MHSYHWQGINAQGKRITGINKVVNKPQLLAELHAQHITPLTIRREKTSVFWSSHRIKTAHISDFTQQLAALHSTGIALVSALQIIGEHHDHPSMCSLVAAIRRDIEAGNSFSEALRKYPNYFDAFYCDLIHAGEQSGTLANMLQQIVIHQEKMAALRQKITKALIYPTTVVIIACLVTGVLLGIIVPRFAALFANFGAELPYYTRLVITLANAVKSYGLLVIFMLGAGCLLYRLARQRSPAFATQSDRLTLQLPLLKNLLQKTIWARFARTLATTYQAGMPITDALPLIANIVGNRIYQNAVQHMREQVLAGTALNLAAHNTRVFSPRMVQILAIGEESGSLAPLLEKMASLFEQEVDIAVENLSKLLEPAIMLLLGIVIGGLIAAMYLPIFRIGAVI
ncbi:MAG: type II secretion system F family protein [Gammaproteobacteria bacterium]